MVLKSSQNFFLPAVGFASTQRRHMRAKSEQVLFTRPLVCTLVTPRVLVTAPSQNKSGEPNGEFMNEVVVASGSPPTTVSITVITRRPVC